MIKFVQCRFMKKLADTITSPDAAHGLGVLYAVHAKIEFIIVLFKLPAIFRVPVRQDSDKAHFL